jgi:hypothetical protein
METALYSAIAPSKFDVDLVKSLNTKVIDMRAVRKERMIIGIRNEQRQIYRVIGITGLGDFMNTIVKLRELDLVDELEHATDPVDGYDAIFGPT